MQKEKLRIKPKHYINYLILGIVLVLFLALELTGLLKRGDALLLTKIGYSIVLAVSLNLVVGFLGELSLGHAGFMCVGAFVGGYVYLQLLAVMHPLLALLIALPVGGLLAAVCGFLIGLPTLRLKGDYLAIVTLAFGEIIRTIFANEPLFGAPMGMASQKFDTKMGGNYLFALALALALCCVFVAQNLRRSKHGRAIQAIRDNEIAARAMGVNVTYYKLIVFVIAAAFAGMAGVLYTGSTSLVESTAFSFNYSIDILVMVVLGGMGNLTGSIIAAAFLTYVKTFLQANLPGELAAIEPLLYALILIIVVMWNNAPAIRPVREKLGAKLTTLRQRIFAHKHEEGGTDAPETAAWDKVPTKIPMDTILSTDFTIDRTFEADAPDKKGGE